MDTFFLVLTIHLCHQLKSVKEVGILPDPIPPPVGPEGQIWAFPNRKLEILMTLLFIQLLKLKDQKHAQNFYFPTKKWIFFNFNYCLKKILGQY